MLSQFSSIFTQMVALFAAIGVGYICKKTGVMDADFDKRLSGLVLSARCCADLASVLNVDSLPDPVLMAQIIGLSVLSYVLFIPIAYIVTYVLRIPDGRRGVYRFMLIFGNTGFIGYPVLSAIFGRRRSYTRLCTTSCSTCCRSPSAPGSSHRTTNTASRCV
mgnify:CR=1 FL=1